MKKILKLLVCFLHPVAVVLAWVDLYTEKGGVRADLWAIFYMATPHLTFNIDVSPGYVKTAAIQLSGGAGFSVIFKAGADKDFQTNMHLFGQVPLNIEFPVLGLGVPFSLKLINTFKLDTAFSAKTSVLQARADYSAGGALNVGYIDNTWGASGMKMDMKHNLADSVSGISVGINSLVFGVNQTLMVGLGAFGFQPVLTWPWFQRSRLPISRQSPCVLVHRELSI